MIYKRPENKEGKDKKITVDRQKFIEILMPYSLVGAASLCVEGQRTSEQGCPVNMSAGFRRPVDDMTSNIPRDY